MYNEIKKIEKIFVINLKSRPDRKLRMQQLLSSLFDALDMKIKVTFFPAIDARNITKNYLKTRGFRLFENWVIPKGAKIPYYKRGLFTREWAHALNYLYKRGFLKGEIACALSHYFVWKKIKKEKIKRALILEDDSACKTSLKLFIKRLESSFRTLKKKEPDWDFLYLCSVKAMPDRYSLTHNLVAPSYSYCLAAYVLVERGVNKLLNANMQKNIVPVDEFIPALYCQHPRKDIDKLFGTCERLRAFAVEPNLLYQCEAGKDGDIETSEIYRQSK